MQRYQKYFDDQVTQFCDNNILFVRHVQVTHSANTMAYRSLRIKQQF